MRAARAGHAAQFGFKPPSYREAERRAEAMQSADAGALLALAILAALDLETRREVAARLGTMAGHGRAYQQAADLAAATALNAGESMDLARALAVLASRAEP